MSTSRRVRLCTLALAGAIPLITALGQAPTAAMATPTREPARPGRSTAATPPSPKTHTVAVGHEPFDVAVSQRLGQALVVDNGGVTILSLTTHRRLADVDTGGEDQNAITLVSRETRAYITDYLSPHLAILDTETRRLLPPLDVGTGAVDVVSVDTPRGQRAYVAYNQRKQLTGITTSTSSTPARVSQHISVPRPVETLTAGPGGTTVWAGSADDGHVFVVDTHTGKVIRSIDLAAVGPISSIAFSPDGKHVWVTGIAGLAVLDTGTGTTLKVFPVLSLFTSRTPNMGAVALTGTGRYAYVEDSTFPDFPARGELAMIDTRSYRIVHHVPTGTEPLALVIDTHRNTGYVPDYAADTVTYFPTER